MDGSEKREGEGGEGKSPARERVLKHLRAAAVAGAGIAMACQWPPSGGTNKPSNGGSDQPPPPDVHHDGPPIVCDPLPPPVNCDAISDVSYVGRFVSKEAVWVKSANGLAVQLTVVAQNYNPESTLGIGGDPKVKGAGILAMDKQPRSVALTLAPQKGAKAISVDVPLTCSGRSALLKLEVTLDKPPVEAEPLEVKAVEK